MRADKSGQRQTRQESTSRWEWITAALGALLIASFIGYMIHQGLTQSQRDPPTFSIQVLAIVRTEGGFLVQFRARNTSNSTAATVLVKGAIKEESGATVEESEAQLDYLPQHSEREGGLYFTRDPSQLRLELRAEGYAEP